MSDAEVVIRRATRREIPEVEELSVAAYAQYRSEVPASVFEGYVADLRRLSDSWQEAEVLVAEVAGRIDGSVQFFADASTEGLGLPQGWAGFRKLAVHPRARGRGLGRRLTEACLDGARARSAPTVGIHTASFMRAARKIYEQMGFRRCAEFDLSAADLGLGEAGAEVGVIAYRLDVAL
ncbi:MAG TPA: GNAT family N-acetyltransferase [Candidatus Binatia bacterium]